MDLLIKRLTTTAKLPTRGSADAVGYDLSADLPTWSYGSGSIRHVNTIVRPQSWSKITTGISAAIPIGYYGRVAPRSGLALKHGIDVLAGVIDPDYRGDISVILMNHGDDLFEVTQGMRIAQLVIERCALPQVVELDHLPDTVRGIGAYGSTGV